MHGLPISRRRMLHPAKLNPAQEINPAALAGVILNIWLSSWHPRWAET
jgi:hypothetical protein